jgi:hypothetical protein
VEGWVEVVVEAAGRLPVVVLRVVVARGPDLLVVVAILSVFRSRRGDKGYYF